MNTMTRLPGSGTDTRRILIIDDDQGFSEVLEAVLSDTGYQVRVAHNGAEGLAALSGQNADLILLDLRMPDAEGVELIARLRAISPKVAIVMMTAYGTIRTAVSAIRLGAFDFLTKPFDLEEMKLTVRNALTLQGLGGEPVETAGPHGRHLYPGPRGGSEGEGPGFPGIIGSSPAIRAVFDVMHRVAAHDVTVLIGGESGTGKELVARALHQESKRKNGPFVAINCAALPEALLESELFGHEKGAFTGAHTQRAGKFESARGGTLFLDEVGDMSAPMQAKLLRVLEEQEFERVGGHNTIKTDLRILAASNKDLKTEVDEHRFRGDLFYRLNVVSLRLPALRERPEDIAPLAERFVMDFARRYEKDLRGVDRMALDCLRAHNWPGNIRELKHVIEQAVLLADSEFLKVKHLPAALQIPIVPKSGSPAWADGETANPATEPSSTPDAQTGSQTKTAPYTDALDDVEKQYIRAVLDQCGWNRSKASHILGVHRNTLREKVKRLGLER